MAGGSNAGNKDAENTEEAGYSWFSAFTDPSSNSASVFAQAQSWYAGDNSPEASPTDPSQQNLTPRSGQGSPGKNPMLRRSRTSLTSTGYKDGTSKRRSGSQPSTPPPTGTLQSDNFQPGVSPRQDAPADGQNTSARKDRAGDRLRAAAHSVADSNHHESAPTTQSTLAAAVASLYGTQGQDVQQTTARDSPRDNADDGNFTLTGLWGAATVGEIWKNATDSIYDATGMSAADRELERALRAAIRNGADAASEYWAAHHFAADQTLELQLLEQTMNRYGRAGLQNELREAEALADQALKSSADAQELLANARRQEEGVADNIKEANSKAARMDELSQELHQNHESERYALLMETATEHDEVLDEYDLYLDEYEEAVIAFEKVRRQKDNFAEERMLAEDADIRARRLVAHNTVSLSEAQEEFSDVQRECNMTNSEVASWSSQRKDISASLQVNACLVEALEADADYSGKVASSELLEAQQMQGLVQAELRQVGFYEDECDRLLREIRDLSRHQRAR